LYYTGREKWLTPPLRALLILLPLTTLVLVFTNETHHLIWQGYKIEGDSTFFTLRFTYGPWFWVHTATSYLWILIGGVLLLRGLDEARLVYRWQRLALLVGIVTPWVGNIIYITRLIPWPGVDLTPFAATAGAVVVARALFTFRLLDLV